MKGRLPLASSLLGVALAGACTVRGTEEPILLPAVLSLGLVENQLRLVELHLPEGDGVNLTSPGVESPVSYCYWPTTGEVVVSSFRDGGVELHMVSLADPSFRQSLTEGGNHYWEVACSPDGSTIAVTSDTEISSEVLILGLDGGPPRRVLAEAEVASVHPIWSPDGSHLALLASVCPSMEAGAGPWGIWIVDVRSGEVTHRIEGPADPGADLAWSPDGSRLAYSLRRNGQSADVYVYDLSTGIETAVARSDLNEIQPEWAPSGGELAFLVQTGASNDMRQIATWSPAGEASDLLEDGPLPLEEVLWVDEARMLVATYSRASDSTEFLLLTPNPYRLQFISEWPGQYSALTPLR